MADYITLEHLRRAVAALVEKIQDKVSVEDINIEDVDPYSIDVDSNYVIGNIAGKDIKISSDWVNEVVPAPIIYSNIPATRNSAIDSLVTAGDKYNWNNKLDMADIPIGYVSGNTLYIKEPLTGYNYSTDFTGYFYFFIPSSSAGLNRYMANTVVTSIKWKKSDGSYETFTGGNNMSQTFTKSGLYLGYYNDGAIIAILVATESYVINAVNAAMTTVASDYVPRSYVQTNAKQYITNSYTSGSTKKEAVTYLGPDSSSAPGTRPGGVKITDTYTNSTATNKTSVEISAKNGGTVSIYDIPTPTIDGMAANKKYVDDAISGVNSSISGINTTISNLTAADVGATTSSDVSSMISSAIGNITAADVGATTSSDVSSMISNAVGGIHSFEVSVVSSLPTTNIDTHTIYYVRNNSSGSNIYDEYMYINSAWENIGSTQVDLSGYAPLASPAFTTQISIGNATMTASQLSTLFSSPTFSNQITIGSSTLTSSQLSTLFSSPTFSNQITIGSTALTSAQLSTLFTSPTFSNQITIGSSTLTSSQLSTLFSSPTFSTQITIGSTTLTESQLSTLISFVSGLQAAAGVSF